MIEKTQIDSVFINTTKADGTPYIDKNGSLFKIATIKWTTAKGEEKKASMMISGKYGAKDEAVVSQWKAGDNVEITLEQNGDFTNFKIPSRLDLLERRIEMLEDLLIAGKAG